MCMPEFCACGADAQVCLAVPLKDVLVAGSDDVILLSKARENPDPLVLQERPEMDQFWRVFRVSRLLQTVECFVVDLFGFYLSTIHFHFGVRHSAYSSRTYRI